MAKGSKKRRASRKKQEKALQDTQAPRPSATAESCPLEENEEDVFSPKTPVQANEGEDKDRMFDMVGGLAHPSSHTEEVAISDGVEYKCGSFENAVFQEFSPSGRGEVGDSEILGKVSERNGPNLDLSKGSQLTPLGQFRDWGVSRKIDDKHASLQSSTQEGDEGNAVSFDRCETDLIEASKPSELEIRNNNKNIVECMHNEGCTIRDIAVNDFSFSPTDDITTSQKFRDISEGFPLVPPEVVESFNSCMERESAMQKEDEMNSLSKQQSGHGQETAVNNSEPSSFDGNSSKDEIGYKDREVLVEVQYGKRSIEHSGSHDILERLVSHKSHASEADDPIPSEMLAIEVEKIESPAIFDEGYSMSSFQGVLGTSSPRKQECNSILAGEGGLEPAQGHSENVKDVSVDIIGQDDADTSKQVKDELWDFYGLTQPNRESIEILETYESNAYQAHNCSLSERLEIETSVQGGLENLQEHNGCENGTNLDNSESRIFEMLQSMDNYRTDHVDASQPLQNAKKLNLFLCNSCIGFCITPKGVCMSSSQALYDTKNLEQMESTIAVELEEPQLLHEECKSGQDLCMVSSEHVCAEVNNQSKDANARNDNIQGAGTKRLKEEYPNVSFPAAEIKPSVNTSHSLVAADLESIKSSSVVLLDNEVNNDNGSNLRDISKEPAQQTQFLKLNGEEKDVHLQNTFPGELRREGEDVHRAQQQEAEENQMAYEAAQVMQELERKNED